jgi:hypothetical protein
VVPPMPLLSRRFVEEICVWHQPCSSTDMAEPMKPDELEPHGPEGVPVDAPDNTAPAISPHAVTRMPRAEDDEEVARHSPDFSDEHQKPKNP